MGGRENLISDLQNAVEDAHSALSTLETEVQEISEEALARLGTVLAYARLVIDGTDADLLGDAQYSSLHQALRQIADDANGAATGEYTDAICSALAPLPASRGEDWEQKAKEAAARYQQSMAQRIADLAARLTEVETDFENRAKAGADGFEQRENEMREELTALVAERDEQLARLTDDFTTREQSLKAELEQLSTAISAQQTSLAEQLSRNATAFDTAETERTTEFRETFEKLTTDAKKRVDGFVAEAEKLAGDLGVLSAAVAERTTADEYEKEAKRECRTANWLRGAAVVVALLGALVAAWAVHAHSDTTRQLVAKLALTGVLGGVATYLGSQSAKHRRRELRAKEVQLQLVAFGPFVAPLDNKDKNEIRLEVARSTFGHYPAHDPHGDDSPSTLGRFRGLLRGSKSGLGEGPSIDV